MQALTRFVIDESVVVDVTETSVDDFDGYALTLTTKDPSVTLVLVGTASELRQLIDAAIGGLDVIASDHRAVGPSRPGKS